ncbi:glycosyltransferase family 4 protein [Ammoniphilus sp. 3BR4]|uniref:glycosyltransferase family 4 protein n=1 Tax=Ammoniphilus sp. 3BR4 TaxID=3158265 RepID=UPI003465F945
MRVALICPNSLPCPPIRSGAIELLLHRMAPYLARLGHQVTVFSIQDRSLPNREILNHVSYIRYPKARYIKEVSKYLKREFFDVIHIYNKFQWVKEIRKCSPKSRLVLSFHNLRLGHFADDEVSMEVINTVDHFVTVSQFVAKDMNTRYPASSGKTTSLYTGEDPFRYIPHYSHEGQSITSYMKHRLGIPQDYRIVLFVGRLVEYKGCHLLIQAMKNVQKHFPKTALVIVGSRWFGDKKMTDYINGLLKSAAKLKHFHFTNFIPVDQIPRIYTMSDILVCPSQWEEPLARVHYEAMAAGLPVVTSHRGGNPEIIRNGTNGFVVSRYNQSDEYAKAICQLLEKPQLCVKMGRANRKLIEQRYNFKQYALNLSKLYKKIING